MLIEGIEYLPIPGIAFYFASRPGFIYSTKRNKVMKGTRHKKGYLQIDLQINGKSVSYKVHRLIALTFKPNPENKPEVNHLNAIKDDNRIENLDWATSEENSKHARDLGIQKIIKGKEHPCYGRDFKGEKSLTVKLNNEKVLEIRKLICENKLSGTKIAEMFEIQPCTVSAIKYRRIWSHLP